MWKRNVVIVIVACVHASCWARDAIRFDIPRLEADAALTLFAQQAGVRVLFPYETLRGRTANELVGEYQLEDGLAILLDGTGLEATATPGGQLTIRRIDNQTGGQSMRQRGWLGSLFSALAAFGAGGSASAQDAADEAPAEVTITGSRIQQRSGMVTPTPVTMVTADDLQNLAPGTLMDALEELPQFVNSGTVETAGSWTSVGGQSVLNLRGIGSNRTLVLLNGRRVVPTNRLSTIDVSLFPQPLVQRVEVVTGGASAAYGSDAVSGVVNFILDTEFTGLEAEVQGGQTSRGDQDNYSVSLAGGRAVGSRAHAVFGLDYYKSGEISNYHDRDWYQDWGVLTLPGNTDGPLRVRRPNVHSMEATYGGLIRTGPLAGTQFLADGTPAPFQDGTIVNSNRSMQVGGDGINFARDEMVVPSQKRYSAFGNLKYDIGDETSAFVQALYGYSLVDNYKLGYVISGPWAATIYDDNAFLPESIRTRMQEEGITQFTFSTRRRADELNNARAPLESKMFSVTTGIDGKLGNWRYNTYYQYGQSTRFLELHGFRVDRLYKGLDAVRDAQGNIVCRSTLSFPDDGCVPLNLFGIGQYSEEAREWVQGSGWLDTEVTQHVAEASINGDLFDNWAGPVSFAAGVSYKKDKLDQVGGDPNGSPVPDPPNGPVRPAAEEGYRGLPAVYVGYGLIDRAGFVSIGGEFDVKEIFTETIVPLVRNVTGFQSVDLTLAGRFADYSGSGGSWAWKGGLDWQVTDAWRIRLTRSRDVRAGTLAERFDITRTGANIVDPFLPGNPEYQIRTVFGGNPAVEPEEADTITFGTIYQPTWLPGFAVSADVYDIKIRGAIAQLGNQNIIDQCFAGVQRLCDLIVRNPETGAIDNVFNTYINVDQARTRGLDLEMSYGRPIELFGGGERLRVRLIGTYTDEASTTNLGAEKIDRANQTGAAGGVPRLQANLGITYSRGPLTVNWQERFIRHGKWDASWVEGVDIDDNSVPSRSYSSVRVTYDLEALGGQTSVFANVSNLFDRAPPEGATQSLFSAVGRAYTVGVKVAF